MKQQSRFRIKPIEIVTGVSVATGIMMLLSVIGALLINKDLVPENSIIHMAMAIHFLSVCISSFALKLIYECDNALQTIIISFAYFSIEPITSPIALIFPTVVFICPVTLVTFDIILLIFFTVVEIFCKLITGHTKANAEDMVAK